MSAILRILPRYYSLEMSENGKKEMTSSGLGLAIWDNDVIILNGKDAGKAPEEVGVIKAGQTAVVNLGKLRLFKYLGILAVNPELFSVATVQIPTFVEPGSTDLLITIAAHKQVSLSEFNHLVKLHIID